MIRAYSGFLSIRYLRTRWVNLLGMIGVAVAVWALIVVIAVFSGFIGEIRSGIRIATPDLLCTGLPPETSFDAVDALLHEDDAVLATAPRLRHYAMYFPSGARGRRIERTHGLQTTPLAFDYVELIGIDPRREQEATQFGEWLAQGAEAGLGVTDPDRPLEVPAALEADWRRSRGLTGTPGPLLGGSPGILLSTRRVQGGLLALGQELSVVTGRFVQRDGESELRQVRRYFAIAGAFRTPHRVLDDTAALVSIDELRGMLGHPPDSFDAVDLVSDVAIRIAAGADAAAVAKRLEQRLADDFGASVLTWEAQNKVYLGAVDQERGMMKIILFAVMLVSAFLIYATLHMTVTQKTKDIGILTAIGGSPAGVQQIFLLSGATVGLAGCALGVVTGLLSAHYLNDINDWTKAQFGVELFPTSMYALERIPYRVDAEWVVQVVLLALAITLLAAWLPARRAARMDPVRALSYE